MNKSISNYYLENEDCLVIVVEGYICVDNISENIVAALTKIKENGISNILFDCSKLSILEKKCIHWLRTYWYPRAMRLNISNFYFVEPKSVFGKESIKLMNNTEGLNEHNLHYTKSLVEGMQTIKADQS